MSLRRRLITFLAAGLASALAWAGASPAELARIDRLIEYVASRSDVKFIRNGSEYSCHDAARFMRGKMKAMGGHVTTAQQFIEQIASKSSTTGQPYQIRLSDGKTIPSAQFLGEELQRMDAK